MPYASCPTATINAPVEIVWALLTCPEAWGDFYDVRIESVDPPGVAVIGQTVRAGSGPRFLHLKLCFRFNKIDPLNYELGLDVQLPFCITAREDLRCVGLGQDQCRVAYRCDFGLPGGWRGTIARLLLRYELEAGPVDSLSRLQRAAEQHHASRVQTSRPGRIR
jgi:hypothetical protein